MLAVRLETGRGLQYGHNNGRWQLGHQAVVDRTTAGGGLAGPEQHDLAARLDLHVRVGVQVARSLGGEIISADSRQVFRGMDLGTGKDLSEYGDIPYHLIDIKNPGEEFIFVFKGELELTLGSKVFHLKQGETIHFDSETKHKLRNVSEEKCELIVTLYTP